jgi:Cu/Ag efflux protein CusF
MRTILGAVTAAALTLTAGVALADEATGTIQSIDQMTKMLTVGDKSFQWSSENSLGVKLEELQEGDQVKIMFEPNQDGTNSVQEITKE